MTAGPIAPYRIRPSVVRDGLARPCGAENGPVVYARLVLASGAARDGGSKSRCGGKSGTRAVADNTLIIKQKSILHVGKTRQDKSLFRSLSDTYLPPLRCVVLKKGKRLRGYVLTRFLRFRTFAHGNVKNRLTWKQKKQQFRHLQQDCTSGHGCDTTRCQVRFRH